MLSFNACVKDADCRGSSPELPGERHFQEGKPRMYFRTFLPSYLLGLRSDGDYCYVKVKIVGLVDPDEPWDVAVGCPLRQHFVLPPSRLSPRSVLLRRCRKDCHRQSAPHGERQEVVLDG